MTDKTNKYLGSLCKRGHDHEGTGKSLRYSNRGSCVECTVSAGAKWRKANPEKVREYTRKWREANPEKITEYMAWRFLTRYAHIRKEDIPQPWIDFKCAHIKAVRSMKERHRRMKDERGAQLILRRICRKMNS